MLFEGVCLVGIAAYGLTSQLAPYGAPWSAPWHVDRCSRASAAAHAAIRLGVLALIGTALIFLYAAVSGQRRIVPVQSPTGAPIGVQTGASSGAQWNLPDLTWLWMTAGALALACAAVALIKAARRRESGAAAAEPGEESDAASAGSWVDEGISEILAAHDARRAILACYAVMERRLGKLGIPRSSAETAPEYARRLLQLSGAPPQPVSALTELFHLAGYSNHPIDESMRRRAVDSLLEISAATV